MADLHSKIAGLSKNGCHIAVVKVQRHFVFASFVFVFMMTIEAILSILILINAISITVASTGKPKIQPFNFPNEVNLDHPILLITCIVTAGEKPITFEWLKDGQTLKSGDEVNIKHHEIYSLLELKNLKSKHIGNYTCLARNRQGVDSFTSNLLMKVPPFWTKEPVDVKVSAGSKLVVDCLANGYPIPKIYWRLIKNNQIVDQINSSSLIFESISLSNRGNYECVAENSVGFPISKTIYIEVVGKDG